MYVFCTTEKLEGTALVIVLKKVPNNPWENGIARNFGRTIEMPAQLGRIGKII